MKPIYKKTLISISIVFAIVMLLLIMVFKFDILNTELNEKSVIYFSKKEPVQINKPDTLKVLTWNIKFGGARIDFFFDCYGDRVIMEEAEVLENLKGLTQKINELNPDIVFLQEVDIESKRSAYVNQIQNIIDNTKLQYGVFASQWRCSYVPSNGIGKINSGNVILSKWKINNAKRIALPLIGNQSKFYQHFYLKRNVLVADIFENQEKLTLLNTHLSAYSKDDTQKNQLDIVHNLIEEYDKNSQNFILAGDFNLIPPYSKKLNGFDDAACKTEDFSADDYSKKKAWMAPLYRNYFSAINLEDYKKENKKYYSHTTNKNGFWNRKLDYLFSNKQFVPNSDTTYQNTMKLSDHCPILVKYKIK